MRAAIGIRAHSGWAAVVVVAGRPGAVEVIDRRKILITDPGMPGANQPYHFVAELALPDAERHLARCAARSEQLALDALSEIITEVRLRDCSVETCAILLASGRELPALGKILDSHALIHTAEGEFFRQCFRSAGERLRLEVRRFREKDIDELAKGLFGRNASALESEIAGLGRILGPPWTIDQKSACLAALLALA